MKQEILDLITVMKKPGPFDSEKIHMRYDRLLEKFIFNPDPEVLPLMQKLIRVRRTLMFWYA